MSNNFNAPLAERMRPRTLDEVIGLDSIIGQNSALGKILRSDFGIIPSMIFWGPPGTGKTTLARVIAEHSNYNFVRLSGVLDGVKEIREVVEEAKALAEKSNKKT
jgi:putative ATPase